MKRERIRVEFTLRQYGADGGPKSRRFDPNELLEFIRAGLIAIGADGYIEPGSKLTITAQPAIGNGMKVKLRSPGRGQPRSIGKVVGHPRVGTYATRIYWPTANRTMLVPLHTLAPA